MEEKAKERKRGEVKKNKKKHRKKGKERGEMERKSIFYGSDCHLDWLRFTINV